MKSRVFRFDELERANLVVDAVYEGGSANHWGDDPISRLLPVGNQGGFRSSGSASDFDLSMVVLFSSGHNVDWPDFLDLHSGQFVYFGDNKKPGHALHDTPRKGNEILRTAFERLHSGRADIPPFFVFEGTGEGRNVRFRGLAVPGAPNVGPDDDLVAVWRTTGDERFQNYRAIFTVLDENEIPREWIDDLIAGEPITSRSPTAWGYWAASGRYRALEAPRTVVHRTKEQQLPSDPTGKAMLQAIRNYFESHPTAFEACAVSIWQMVEPSASSITVTQASRDGGRDAIGRHYLGPETDRVVVDFAIEAKCYAAENGVGVKDVSRLISRLLHRQYGVLVTTSYLGSQPYKEIRQDGHPVVVIAGVDIVNALQSHGVTTVAKTQAWLVENFKVT